jgi:hypothetical protein
MAEQSALQIIVGMADSAGVDALNHIGLSADGDSAVGMVVNGVTARKATLSFMVHSRGKRQVAGVDAEAKKRAQ